MKNQNSVASIVFKAVELNPLLGERPLMDLIREAIKMAKAGMDEYAISMNLVGNSSLPN